jgi:hypothetical protein
MVLLRNMKEGHLKNNNAVSASMNMAPMNMVMGSPPEIPQPNLPVDEKEDKSYARQNMIGLIEIAKYSLMQLVEIAGATQDPEHYAQIASLIRTTSNVNKDLLNLNEELTKKTEDGEKEVNITHQNLFVGSTTELQELIDGKKTKSERK